MKKKEQENSLLTPLPLLKAVVDVLRSVATVERLVDFEYFKSSNLL